MEFSLSIETLFVSSDVVVVFHTFGGWARMWNEFVLSILMWLIVIDCFWRFIFFSTGRAAHWLSLDLRWPSSCWVQFIEQTIDRSKSVGLT
jgi:hypothetical protein